MRRVWGPVTLVAGLMAAGLAGGCSPHEPSSRDQSARTVECETPASALLTDAGEVLDLVGLTLPADATDVVVERRELSDYIMTANYVVRFTASRESVEAFAVEYGQGKYYPGHKPTNPGGTEDWSVYDGTWERGFEEFGLTTAPAGSRHSTYAVHTPTGQAGSPSSSRAPTSRA